MTAEELDFFRSLIEQRRAALLAIDASGQAATDVVELDQARVGRLSRMDAMQQQAMARATDGRRKAELRRLAGALARLERGEFGYCEACDEAIATGRLRFDPGVTLCVACAERA